MARRPQTAPNKDMSIKSVKWREIPSPEISPNVSVKSPKTVERRETVHLAAAANAREIARVDLPRRQQGRFGILLLAVAYLLMLLLLIRGNYGESLLVLTSPVVGHFNASSVIRQRQKDLYSELTLHLTKDWTAIRRYRNISICRLGSGGPLPGLLMTIASIPAPVNIVESFFRWEQFNATQSLMNPFHQSVTLEQEVDHHKIFIESTKEVLWFASREYHLAYSWGRQQGKDLSLSCAGRHVQVPRGAPLMSLLNINWAGGAKAAEPKTTTVRGAHDSLTWFVHNKSAAAETTLIQIMRSCAGGDIPDMATLVAYPYLTSKGLGALQRALQFRL